MLKTGKSSQNRNIYLLSGSDETLEFCPYRRTHRRAMSQLRLKLTLPVERTNLWVKPEGAISKAPHLKDQNTLAWGRLSNSLSPLLGLVIIYMQEKKNNLIISCRTGNFYCKLIKRYVMNFVQAFTYPFQNLTNSGYSASSLVALRAASTLKAKGRFPQHLPVNPHWTNGQWIVDQRGNRTPFWRQRQSKWGVTARAPF